MIIPGEKVLLRPIHPADFPQMVAWSNDPDINAYIEGDYPRTLDECGRWYEEAKSDRYRQSYAVVSAADAALIGDIELDHIAWRSGDAELRIRIGDATLWDQGYGADAVRCLVGHAFEAMRLERVYLRVLSENKRAIRCYEKVGFRKEGRLQRKTPDNTTVTVLLMRLLKHEYAKSQPKLDAKTRPARTA